AKLNNIYIILMLITTIWMGAIGFLDDYIKVFKKDKEGLAGRFKILGQIVLGLIVGVTMYYHKDVVIREKIAQPTVQIGQAPDQSKSTLVSHFTSDMKST